MATLICIEEENSSKLSSWGWWIPKLCKFSSPNKLSPGQLNVITLNIMGVQLFTFLSPNLPILYAQPWIRSLDKATFFISLPSNTYHHGQRQDQKHAKEVDEGEPAVLCSGVAKDLAEGDGHAHELDWVEDEDANHIEEQVNKGNVETVLDGLLARASQGC